MFDDDDSDMDEAIANMTLPPDPKIPKIQAASAAIPSGSSSGFGAKFQIKSQKPDLFQLPTTSSEPVKAPAVPVRTSGSNPLCILVHPKQRGNPILKSISNCPLEFRDDIVPDYVVGRTTCILYLSLKYHNLNPDYIVQRLKQLGKMYELRVLLVQVDTPEPYNALKNLTRVSLLADLTLMLAWNADEAGKIIETYKTFEKKPPDMIMERVDSNPHQKMVAALTNIKPVNKTDAVTLIQDFGTLENMILASEDRLSLVTGLGPRKAKKLYKTLNESFLSK